MKKLNSFLTLVLAVLLLPLFISSCGKKDSTTGTGSVDSKKETSTESKSTDSKKETSTENKSADSKKEATYGAGSSDIDGMIDDYQILLDKYVTIVTNVKSGKMSEIAEMKELSAGMSEWSKKFSDIAPQLTDAQKERIKKITEAANDLASQ